jgi:LAO/AO transport system kinase
VRHASDQPEATHPPAPPPRRGRLAPDQYIEGVLRGDRVVLARAITVIESELPADADLAGIILEGILPYTGQARRVGVTGVPGAGKSTLIDALGLHIADHRYEKVAVLSIDPSSVLSRGAILGDKVRMERLAAHERAFIRPSASRGHLGGVARRTREVMLLCEAAGFTNIIVETVGVGQSETAVRSMTDFFLLVMIPGAGDELQGIKRGIFEMADHLVINKADGDNLPRARRALAEYSNALHLFPPAPDGWVPTASLCSALTGDGIPEIWTNVLAHRAHLQANGWFDRHRREQALAWMRELIALGLESDFYAHPAVRARLPALEQAVRDSRTTSYSAARELLALFHRKE